jgi:hypothetical protein
MEMMNIIVALVALFGVLVTASIGFLTWSRNLKYQILRDERDRLEKKGDFILEKFSECLAENKINAKLAALINFEFPKNVAEEFEKSVESGVFSTQDESKKKEAFFNMAYEISKAIRDYNIKIQRTSEFVDKQFAFKQLSEIAKIIPQDIFRFF